MAAILKFKMAAEIMVGWRVSCIQMKEHVKIDKRWKFGAFVPKWMIFPQTAPTIIDLILLV